MDRVLYLVHIPNSKYDDTWTELKPSSIDNINDQFPGVYLSLITIDNLKKEQLYGSKKILIFSKKLLEQQNYHINIEDYNGFINEKNTYFPWQLDKAVRKIKNVYKKNKYPIGNEVIFHDAISMKYLCAVINNISINFEIKSKYNVRSSLLLPQFELYNDELPDMTKLPFFCMPFEENFTGYNKRNLSSQKFYQKMAILCNINKNQCRETIIENIKPKAKYFYNNRNEQNLEEFKKLF